MKTLELLKQVTTVNEAGMAKAPASVKEILKKINDALVGEKVKAFGKKGRGLWVRHDEEMTFTIKAIRPHHYELADYGVIDVVLDGYKASKYGLIYTDLTFLKSFKELLVKKDLMQYVKSIDYSEQGMQGNNFVNLDFVLKKPKIVK